MQKEILVAIDGSVYSNQSLTYLSTLFSNQADIRFHLGTWITTGSTVMPSAADPKNSLIPTSSAQTNKENSAKRYLVKATDKLTRAGIEPERIETSLLVSGYNIAGAIQQSAERKLVDSILVGRRGLNGISEMLMGSVSATLFKKCHAIPLWIIDGEVKLKDFLVPVDGSLGSLMAIDHMCHMLEKREDIHIYLFHCSSMFRKKIQCNPEIFYHKWDKTWCDKHLAKNDCLFDGPQRLLHEAGIPDRCVTVLPQAIDLEEARGILREAKSHNCGTIVMGRRGVGMAKGLFGGVSDRTVKRVQDLALWVIG